MIFEKVLWEDSTNEISIADMKNLRLVCRCWNESVSSLLRRRGKPVFPLTLNAANSVEHRMSVEARQNGKLLDQLAASLNMNRSFGPYFPPYSLTITPDFFHPENFHTLSDFLISFGMALVELNLVISMGSPITFTETSFELTMLHRLSVHVPVHSFEDISVPPTHHHLQPINTILKRVVRLKVLELNYETVNPEYPASYGSEIMQLPRSLTKLLIHSPIGSEDLQKILLENDLRNLCDLELYGTCHPYHPDLLYRILDKFKGQLCSLVLKGANYKRRVLNSNMINFPKMKELKIINIASQCWDIDGNTPDLQRLLPKLHTLILSYTSCDSLRKWTDNSTFREVTKFGVTLIRSDITSHFFQKYGFLEPHTLTIGIIRSIILSFSNIVDLEATFYGKQSKSLKCIFREMPNLVKLVISVVGKDEQTIEPGFWDHILIGAPIEITLALNVSPEFFENINIKDGNNFVSIRNLTSLVVETNLSHQQFYLS